MIFESISLLFSFIALSVSLYTLWSNRKKLNVTIEDVAEIDDRYFNELNELVYDEKHNVIFIKVVNPSPHNISYFDLRIVDTINNKSIVYHTQTSIELFGSKHLVAKADNGYVSRLNPPDANYGFFPSNGFTRIDLSFPVDENLNEILVTFKVAIHSFKKNKISNVRRRFKYYEKNFILPNPKQLK